MASLSETPGSPNPMYPDKKRRMKGSWPQYAPATAAPRYVVMTSAMTTLAAWSNRIVSAVYARRVVSPRLGVRTKGSSTERSPLTTARETGTDRPIPSARVRSTAAARPFRGSPRRSPAVQ